MPEFPTTVTAVLVDRRRALPRQVLSSVRMTGYERGPDGSTTVRYTPHEWGLDDPDAGKKLKYDVDGVEVEVVVDGDVDWPPRVRGCRGPMTGTRA